MGHSASAVAVALDEAGDDDFRGEAVVYGAAELGRDFGPAIAEDAPVLHRHMGAAGQGAVEGDDLAGDEDGNGCGHGWLLRRTRHDRRDAV